MGQYPLNNYDPFVRHGNTIHNANSHWSYTFNMAGYYSI